MFWYRYDDVQALTRERLADADTPAADIDAAIYAIYAVLASEGYLRTVDGVQYAKVTGEAAALLPREAELTE